MLLSYSKVSSVYITKSGLFLNEFNGSAFRGAVAKIAKDNLCLCNKERCYGKQSCLYANIFETKNYDMNLPLYKMKIIKPYVFLNSSITKLKPKQKLVLEFLLFGVKRDKYYTALASILPKLKNIGRFKHKGFGKIVFSLVSRKELPFKNYELKKNVLKIFLVSPLIIKRNNQLLESLSLSDFAIACARKAHNMLLFHYNVDPKIDFHVLTKYRDVFPVHQSINRFEMKKWSMKRKRKEQINGITGNLTFEMPDDNEFKENLAKALSIAVVTGIGNLTTHGFGRFEFLSE